VERIWQRFKDDGFQVLGIDQWNGSTNDLKTFFQGPTGVTFPLLTKGASVTADYKVSYDWFVLLDPQHKVYYTATGTLHSGGGAGAVVDAVAIKVNELLAASVTDGRETETVPRLFELRQNYPNPFNPSTTISFNLGQPSRARLNIYNLVGEKIRGLVDGEFAAGEQRVVWDGKDDSGGQAPSGIYFYRLFAVTPDKRVYSESRRLVLAK
jgi:hypothetical protein